MTVSDAREPTGKRGPVGAGLAGGEANKSQPVSDAREPVSDAHEPTGVGAVAVVPVRAGALPLGGDEAIAEAGGTALLVGSGTDRASANVSGVATRVVTAEIGAPAFGAWATALAPVLARYEQVILPGSPDGRDLAPRLAAELGRPLLAGATEIRGFHLLLARYGGLVCEEAEVAGPFVATLQPGVRGCVRTDRAVEIASARSIPPLTAGDIHDAEVLEEIPPDTAAMDLAEATRIFAGGAGLGGAADMALLFRVAERFGAATGATRVVTDLGWVPHERQIGTTGVTVDPDLYVAFGISGAVQHVAGLGIPRRVVSVNTDPSCPMTAMADLVLVTDAPALLHALARRLGIGDG